MPAWRRLCSLRELPISGSTRLELPDQPHSNGLCVIRQGGQLLAYRNQCPHTGGPMDWVPGQFLTDDGELIQCSLHGALFRIGDGYCVSGPCAGASLAPVQLKVQGEEVFIKES